MKHLELNVNNWIKVPKLGKGSFCVSGVFDDGVTVEGYDEKIQYDDICPIEFIGENLSFNGFTSSWRYGMTSHAWLTDTTIYEWVKEIKPGYSYCTVSVNFDNYCKEYKIYYCSLDEPGQLFASFKHLYFHEVQNFFIKLGHHQIADALKPYDINSKK